MIAVLLLAGAGPVLRCGAVPRPSIAERGADGVWRGRAVDACAAAAGGRAQISFRGYDDATMAMAAQDDIAFLSDAERDRVGITGSGPIVAEAVQLLVVPVASPIREQSALSGAMVCVLIGTAAEDALDAWADASGVAVRRTGFQEPDEMADAFEVGRCAALAVDAAELSGAARPLGGPLARVAIRAVRER